MRMPLPPLDLPVYWKVYGWSAGQPDPRRSLPASADPYRGVPMPRLSHHDEHTTRAPVEVCECCEDTASRAQRAARMAVPARALHRAILQAFAGSARPPRYAELEQAARAVGLDPATALAGLAEQDVVVL